MTKPDAWMPLYIADYLRDTTHLSAQEHGAYLLLLMTCWTRGGKLPNDGRRLSAIAKLELSVWFEVAPTILEFFETDGEWLVHRRVSEEVEKAQRLSDLRREAGARGGRPKKQTETKSEANPVANASQNETPSPSPLEEEGPIGPLSPAGDALAKSGDVRQAFELWNDTARRCGLPVAKELTPDRGRKIRSRLNGRGLPLWRDALAAVERSPHCRGENDRGWRADLDFVCQPKSFNRLIEGAYAPKGAGGAQVTDAGPAQGTPEWFQLRLGAQREVA